MEDAIVPSSLPEEFFVDTVESLIFSHWVIPAKAGIANAPIKSSTEKFSSANTFLSILNGESAILIPKK